MKSAASKKQSDPISARARELNARIAELEAKIKKLHRQEPSPAPARMRSTVLPAGRSTGPGAAKRRTIEPVFEDIDQKKLKSELEQTRQHFNELGIRKYDLPGTLRRLRDFFHAQPVANPKLVSYLAAGSIHGLRPLRYEKRVARNRFIFLTALLVLMLWGILYFLVLKR